MPYQKDPNKLENEARIIGYLKESALKEARDDKTREEIISGTITLIADNDMEFRLYCYARRYRKLRQGETTPQKNGNYDKLAELLPTRATSLAGILAQDQTATFENSKSLLTKVFCVAELGERFYYGRDNEVHETIDIRPVTVMKANEQYFRPTASFTCDVFVNGIHPEKKNGEDGLPMPPYRIYNIGNSNPENLLDFVTILQEELIRAKVLPADYDFEAHKKLVPMQPGDVPVTFADTTALEADTGFRPDTPLREGLRRFAEWYKEFYHI